MSRPRRRTPPRRRRRPAGGTGRSVHGSVEAAYDGPLASSSTTWSCPASATSTPPPGSGTALAGKRRSVGSTGGATYGESPAAAPRSRCSATSSPSSASIAWAWPRRRTARRRTLRVDQHQRRPGPGVGLPRDQLGVVQHRVVHGVALDRRRERDRVGLVDELRRVDPDHDQLVGVLLLHRPQLVEDVQAVHAAERPEVEQHEAAAQVAQRNRAVGVEPAAAHQLGGADAGVRFTPPSLPIARNRSAAARAVRDRGGAHVRQARCPRAALRRGRSGGHPHPGGVLTPPLPAHGSAGRPRAVVAGHHREPAPEGVGWRHRTTTRSGSGDDDEHDSADLGHDLAHGRATTRGASVCPCGQDLDVTRQPLPAVRDALFHAASLTSPPDRRQPQPARPMLPR